jgi:flagellar motor switch protein FliG
VKKSSNGRKTIRRISYRQHSDEQIRAAIKAACPEGSIFHDFLQTVCLELVDAATEFERGIREGKRRLAGEILTIAITPDQEISVERNLDHAP